jgi:hypothetical protein
MTREDAHTAQIALMALREKSEGALIVGFGAYAPNSDTPHGSVSVTVTAAGHSATSEAVYLSDAIFMARAKLKREAEARKAAAEEAKKKGGSA